MKKSFHVFFLFTLIAFFATMANAGQVSLTPDEDGDYVKVPASGTDEFTVPQGVTTFKLYDDGGKDGDCTEEADGALVLKAPEGYVFELEGSIYVHSYDLLAVLNGSSGTDTLTKWSGYIPHVGPVYSTQSTIVIAFKQEGYVALSGFDFTVGVVQVSPHTISVANTAGGTLTPSKTSSLPGAPITLNATPDNGYYLSEVVIEGTVGHESVYVEGGKWYTKDTAAFVMPNKDVTVTPVFVQGTPFVNMPTAMRDGITIMVTEKVTEFKIYDDGGAERNYSDNIDGTVEMQVPAGYTLHISGTLDCEKDNDLLSLYSERNTIWDRLSGNQTLDPFETDESIALRFSSNGSVNASGLDITVTLTPKASQTVTLASGIAGTVTLNGTPISAGGSVEILQDAVVNLNITPNDGYMLNGVDVVGGDDNSVQVSGGEWYSNNAASFTMPGQSVAVTPVLERMEDVTELAIKMPTTMENLLEVTLLEDWTTYKVYDEGGKDGHGNGGGMLVLTAPAGKVLMVSGNVTFGSGSGSFVIFDGLYNPRNYGGEMPEMLDNKGVSSSVGPVVSSGNVVTIGFMARTVMMGGEGDNDLDLTVTVTDAPEPNLVELVQETGGIIEASVSEARLGETVTITVDCDDTYLLDGVSVVDEGGNPVAVTGGHWYEGSASFKMPMTAVTVTPSFSQGKKSAEDGLFINLPLVTGAGMGYPTANIPAGVKSFKVYDDGGADASYTIGGDEVLQLIAPSGYLLRVTGSVDLGDDAEFYISTGGRGDEITGVESDIGTYEGSQIMLALSSYAYMAIGGEEHAGLDLTVELVKTTQYAAITVEEVGTKTTATIDASYNGDDQINFPAAIPVDTVVLNRTFRISGNSTYSTLTLPFGIARDKIDGLAEVAEFGGIEVNPETGKKEVVMYRVNGDLQANTPYVVQLSSTSLVFHGPVTLAQTVEPVAKEGEWEFRGTLGKVQWNEGHDDLGKVYGFAAGSGEGVSPGQFVKAAAGAWIGALRAYIIKNPSSKARGYGASASAVTVDASVPDEMDVVIVDRPKDGGEEQTTVIGRINTRTGEFKMERDYDLKGRKLNGKPTARGAYYGKMKIVK